MIIPFSVMMEAREARLIGLTTVLLLTVLLILPTVATSAVISATPANYRSFIGGLNPGDTLQLQGGVYPEGLSLVGLHGEQGSPITITGPSTGAAAELLGRSCCNTVQIEDASYLVVENITLNGQNISGVDGVNGRGITHHITIQNFIINGHGAEQQTNGISTKGPAWDWLIRNNVIVRAGTGMYLGNSDGELQFVRGIIENNLMVDTIGYNLQIKHQNVRSATVGFPVGTNKTIIRHNVFSKAANYSGGDLARPNLLVGHLPLSGDGMNDLYEIYGNFFYQNPSEALFQGEGNIAFYNNIMRNDFGDAINIQKHNDVPRFVAVFHNTVVASNSGIRVVNAASGYQQTVVANAVFSAGGISAPVIMSNITGSYAAAANYLNNPNAQLGMLDFYPKVGMLSGTAIDLSSTLSFTDGNVDFNGKPRSGNYRGAYAGEGVNSGWLPVLEIMPNSSSAGPSNPRPDVSFTVNTNSIEMGGFVSVLWSSTNADSCEASGNPTWAGSKATSAQVDNIVGPLLESTILTLTCTGKGGSTQKSVTITVVVIDNIAPSIDSVIAGINGQSVKVVFSEPVSQVSATDSGNFMIDNGVSILAVNLGADLKTVTLNVTDLAVGVLYHLTVKNISDRAASPNEIKSGSTVEFSYSSSVSTDSLIPTNYQWDTLKLDIPLYTDRLYTVTNFPSMLDGIKFIRTANDDKDATGQNFVSFNVNEPAAIYVGYDERNINFPQWLANGDWVDTNQSIESTDTSAILRLYRMNVSAGTISLGANEYGNSMYVVLVGLQEANSTPDVSTGAGKSSKAGSVNFIFSCLLFIFILFRRNLHC